MEAGAAGRPASPALAELADIPWRRRTDERSLQRSARVWTLSATLHTTPFLGAGTALMALEPLTFPVAAAAAAHAWIIPELFAFRGASVLRPKGPRNEGAERVAQGLLGDLLDHEPRALQDQTGLVLERGRMGVWLVGESGAILVPRHGRRVHCFCVRTAERALPPSDRIAHLLLALRTDEEGFATVANHSFCGARWRVRRRLPKAMRPALDAAARAARGGATRT